MLYRLQSLSGLPKTQNGMLYCLRALPKTQNGML